MAQNALTFLSVSLTMSVLILFVSVLSMLSFRWFQPKHRYAVWLVVLVGFLVPLRPVWGDGLFNIPVFAISQESSALVTIWAVAAFAIFAYHSWRYLHFKRIVKRWGKPVTDEQALALYNAIKKEKGLENKEIKLIELEFVSTSMLTGFFKPVIILPAKQFLNTELEMIFRHELIHYKRGDLYVKLLSVAAVAIHWFNPIAYWLNSTLQTECETSCDEAVLQDIGEENRLYYAELIVEMVGKKKSSTLFSTCFYGGKRSLKRRLDCILETSKKLKKPAYAALVIIIMFSALSGSVFAFSAISPAITPAYSYDLTDRKVMLLNPFINSLTAVEIAMAAVSALEEHGVLDEVDLTFKGGQWVWEVEVDFESDLEAEVRLDIVTGEVISIKWDD